MTFLGGIFTHTAVGVVSYATNRPERSP